MNYDMSGFDFGIMDVAQILQLRRRHGNNFDCPFCGDTKGKLNINTQKDVYRCNRCDASGGMLQLYGALYHVSLSEANQQIREALHRGQYRNDYACKEQETKKEIRNSELAVADILDRTYSEMLSMLTLNEKHQEDLIDRGLTMEQIEIQRYRSTPLFGIRRIVRTLVEKGCVMKGVPGFYQMDDGQWTINFTAKNSGLLLPIVSLEGKIQGFQIRLDHPKESNKYIWLSSVNYEMGVTSGSPVHIIGSLDTDTVYITEGALKGSIAHYLSGNTFLCAAGVNQYRNIKPMLVKLKQQGVRQIIEAYDMDKKMKTECDGQDKNCKKCFSVNPDVCPHKQEKRKIIQNGCKKVYDICEELSLPMSRMVWDTDQNGEWNGSIKGIDDYYYTIKKWRKEGHDSKGDTKR